MRYIGIVNSRKKRELCGRPYRIEMLSPVDVAWDCERHARFLGWFDWWADEAYSKTSYWQYQRKTHSADKADALCVHFAKMYLDAKGQRGAVQFLRTPWAIVTTDGLRLDGSHRAAIARHLGYPLIPVAVVEYRWWDWWWRWRMRRYRDAVLKGEGK